MGRNWFFRFFDGSVEVVADGGLGLAWVKEFALRTFPCQDIWQVSSGNFSAKGFEFFKP